MPDQSPRPKRRRSFGFWSAVIIVAGGVLYPLSTGPAFALGLIPTTSNTLTYKVYAPLAWLDANGPQAFHIAFVCYLRIWGDDTIYPPSAAPAINPPTL